MVVPTATSFSAPSQRNWKRVPTRDTDGCTGTDFDDLIAAFQLPPHTAAIGDEAPDFFNGPMHDLLRHRTGRQRKLRHAAAAKAAEDANLGSVRRHHVGHAGELSGLEGRAAIVRPWAGSPASTAA